MSSVNRITSYLNAEDWKLLQKAIEKYNMKESPLLKEIVHSWLFSNKLQLEGKK